MDEKKYAEFEKRMNEGGFVDIKNAEDIALLMDFSGSFHDGCLKEMVMRSSTYIDGKYSMDFSSDAKGAWPGCDVDAIFQTQWEGHEALELLFGGVKEINFNGDMMMGNDVIFDCAMAFIKKDDETVLVFTDDELDQAGFEKGEYKQWSYLVATTLKVRYLGKGYLGNKPIFRSSIKEPK
jgi:hypothetical protein